MTTLCRRSSCSNFSPYAEELCDPCEEYEQQIHREEYGYLCIHCNTLFARKGGFDRHKWSVFYRSRELPIGQRVRI